jgi:tRNA uridine 5-carbamoylmethylation protein Kti12
MEAAPSTSSSVVVLLLCGLPASGKSSLAKQVCEQVQQNKSRSGNHDNGNRFRTGCCHLIEYDALQESLTDDETDALEAWRQTRGVALQDFQKVLTECVDSLETSSLLILDDNFHLPSMRKQVYQACQRVVAGHRYEHGSGSGSSSVPIYFGIVYVDTPVALCLERNRQRQRAQDVVPDQVICKMRDTLQPPPAPNTYWEQPAAVLRIDGSHDKNIANTSDNETEEHDTVQRVLEFAATLCQQRESKVPPPVDPAVEQERLKAERKRTATSTAHSMDQSLRQLVKIVAQVRPAAASHANRIRQECLLQAKKDLAKLNHQDQDSMNTGDGSVAVAVYAASDSFIEQVLQWQDWTDDERLDVKERLLSSAAALHE